MVQVQGIQKAHKTIVNRCAIMVPYSVANFTEINPTSKSGSTGPPWDQKSIAWCPVVTFLMSCNPFRDTISVVVLQKRRFVVFCLWSVRLFPLLRPDAQKN